MDRDESLVDLQFLQKCLPKPAAGQVDQQRLAQLEMENQKLRVRLADGDDYDFA